MNQDVIIICESMYHGNTKKIAEGMANELKCKVVNCEQAKKMDLSCYKVVGLGSGIYFTSHHPKIVALAKTLGKEQSAFIFSTRGCPVVGKYHNTLKSALKVRGTQVIGEFSCRGYDCTGPYNLVNGGNKGKPNESDVLRARKFIRKILPQCIIKNESNDSKHKHVWINADSCIGCMACIRSCPMKVYRNNEGKVAVVKEEDCVHCNKCVDACPQGCITIKHSMKELIGIAKTHAGRTSL